MKGCCIKRKRRRRICESNEPVLIYCGLEWHHMRKFGVKRSLIYPPIRSAAQSQVTFGTWKSSALSVLSFHFVLFCTSQWWRGGLAVLAVPWVGQTPPMFRDSTPQKMQSCNALFICKMWKKMFVYKFSAHIWLIYSSKVCAWNETLVGTEG